MGKFWSEKKLANLVNEMLFANFLPANYFFLQSVVAILAAHLQIFNPAKNFPRAVLALPSCNLKEYKTWLKVGHIC